MKQSNPHPPQRNQILTLLLLACAHTLILGTIENGGTATFHFYFPLESGKELQTTVKSLYILTYIPPKLSLPRDINRRMGFEPK